MTPDLVLVGHGWLGRPRQFRGLLARLAAEGFDARPVSYPTVFGSFEAAVDSVRRIAVAASPARLHLIGYSLGGLVMRAFAAESPPGLASLLLIGTPNAGSPLADIACRIMPTPALRRLSTGASAIAPPPDGVRIGCIAGARSDWLGWLIAGENDGRVGVSSALALPSDASRVLPVGHNALRSDARVAALAVGFLRDGRF